MSKRRNKCGLCHVKRKLWEDDLFFGINCKKHFTLMIVLKEHKKELTEQEDKILKELLKERYPNRKVNTKLKDTEDHFHIHLK